MTSQPSQPPSQQDDAPLDRQALRAYVQRLDGDQVNDLIQKSATPADAQAVLNAATRAQIQHVADLNYVDDQRTRTAIARDLLSARFPTGHHDTADDLDQADSAAADVGTAQDWVLDQASGHHDVLSGLNPSRTAESAPDGSSDDSANDSADGLADGLAAREAADEGDGAEW